MSGIIAAGRRRTVVAAAPPMSDDFTATLSSTKWPVQNGNPSNVSGRLRIIPSTSYPEVQSNTIFDMTQLYPVHVEIPTLPIVGNGTIQTRFILSTTNYASLVEFQITGNPRIIYMAGAGVAGSTITYSATDHRWLRFRVDTGNLLFETSPDKVTWTNRKTAAAPSWITGGLVRVILQSAQTGAVEASPGFAEFDNFNI